MKSTNFIQFVNNAKFNWYVCGCVCVCVCVGVSVGVYVCVCVSVCGCSIIYSSFLLYSFLPPPPSLLSLPPQCHLQKKKKVRKMCNNHQNFLHTFANPTSCHVCNEESLRSDIRETITNEREKKKKKKGNAYYL